MILFIKVNKWLLTFFNTNNLVVSENCCTFAPVIKKQINQYDYKENVRVLPDYEEGGEK